MQTLKTFFFYLSILRLIPHYLVFAFHRHNGIIKADVDRWVLILKLGKSVKLGLFYLLTFKKEFRNLFYYRIGKYKYFLNPLCPQINSLFLPSKHIGAGLFIEHGFSTIVAAESIGENCWINQQVTIGYINRTEGPTILDNVTINAGAIVIGKITINNDVIIGAGAVVTKSVPPNCTVVGNPARIIRKDREKVNLTL